MEDKNPQVLFDKKLALAYDEYQAKIAPVKDLLHLCMHMVFSEFPTRSRILCVGAGTGVELMYLAKEFPEWQFTVVEPSSPMINRCIEKTEESGIKSRCTFHEGYLRTLPESGQFNAATSILVSQFLTEPEERRNFFREISARLLPGGYLINADLSSCDISSPAFKSMFEVWIRMLEYSNLPPEALEKYRTSFGKEVAVLTASEIETIISSSGFDTPILFYQAFFIHAWYSWVSK